MKNSEKDFDQLIRNSLSDMEIPPPEDLKKGVFSNLSNDSWLQKIKRNSIYLLLIVLVISVPSIFAYKTLHKPADLGAVKVDQDIDIKKINTITKLENNTKNTNDISNDTQKKKQAQSISNNINNNNPTINYDKTQIKTKSQTKVSEEIIETQKENVNVYPVDTKNSLPELTEQALSETNEQTLPEIKELKENTSGEVNNSVSVASANKEVLFTIPGISIIKVIPVSDDQIPLKTNYLAKKIQQPLLWSVGFDIGHSILQRPMINLPEAQNDNQYHFNTSLDFPSAFLGLDFRAEKKHFFFDLGLQYSHFSEKIKSDNIFFNPHEHQYINYSGQTMHADTGGGYYHFYYICDSIISIFDSVWTWKIDTSYINNYDTIITGVYDTLKNSEWKNSYSYLEIPISVGWQYNFGKINIGLKTGPLLCMLIGTKGFIPAKTYQSPNSTALASDFKKFSLGLSWQVSAVASYFLNERFLFECQPYYRFSVRGLKSSSGYTINNNSLGLMIGIRYYF